MVKNGFNFFHIIIIASLLMVATGCGYKKPPYYPKEKASLFR